MNLNLTTEQEKALYEQLKSKFEQPKESGVWMPKEGETYYYINIDGEVHADLWHNSDVDNRMRNANNCFQTQEAAEKESNWRKIDFKIRSVIAKHRGSDKRYFKLHYTDNDLQAITCCDYNDAKCYLFNKSAFEPIKGEITVEEFKTWLDR